MPECADLMQRHRKAGTSTECRATVSAADNVSLALENAVLSSRAPSGSTQGRFLTRIELGVLLGDLRVRHRAIGRRARYARAIVTDPMIRAALQVIASESAWSLAAIDRHLLALESTLPAMPCTAKGPARQIVAVLDQVVALRNDLLAVACRITQTLPLVPKGLLFDELKEIRDLAQANRRRCSRIFRAMANGVPGSRRSIDRRALVGQTPVWNQTGHKG